MVKESLLTMDFCLFLKGWEKLQGWDEYLNFLDYECHQDGFLVVGRNTPGFFSVDWQLLRVKLEYNLFKNRKEEPCQKYLAVRRRQNELYLFFEDKPHVEKINMTTGEEKEIHFVGCVPEDRYIIQGISLYNGLYYMVPASADSPLICFDGEQLIECSGWKERMSVIAGGGDVDGDWLTGYIQKGNEIWFALSATNKLIQTNLDDFQVTEWKIQEESCGLETVAFDGEKFWLMGSNQKALYKWSVENGLENIYNNFPFQAGLGIKSSFQNIVFYKDKVWCIPGSASEILILDKRTKVFRELKFPELIWLPDKDRQRNEKFHAVWQQDSRLILFACDTRQHMVIDMEQERIVQKVDTVIQENDLKKIRMGFLELYNKCTSIECGVRDFVMFVVQHSKVSSKERFLQESQNIGTRIWKEIKKS